jgi:eukaryotic-like serine/threonine-protein kinase
MSRLLAGRYRMGDQIGAGGTSRVHTAVDERLARPVAIKVLDARAVADADPAGRERFLREARTAASFTHPHAVTTFDAGEDDDTLFMVMELVEGPTLASFLADHGGMLPIADALAIIDQVLAALDAAHHQGVVHRDVKPANVLLTTDGVAKLADFGIARRFDDLDAALTAAGLVLGTPRYLAPEQVQGKPTGPSTDVYAVGLMAFEMLSGEVPLVGDTPVATAVARQTQPVPDLRALRPEVPKAVVRVLERALARHPDHRHRDAGAFREELRRAIGVDSTTVPLPITGRTRAVGAPTTVVAEAGTEMLPAGLVPVGATPDTGDDGPPTEAVRVGAPGRDRRPLVAAAAAILVGLALVAWANTGRDDLSELAAGTTTAGDEVEEVIPGFVRSADLWGVLHQLEREPLVVGAAGEQLLTGVRRLLGDESPEWHREAAIALLGDLEVWVADGHLHPAVADEVRRHLEPLVAAPLEEVAPVSHGVEPQNTGNNGDNGRGNGRGGGRGRG